MLLTLAAGLGKPTVVEADIRTLLIFASMQIL